MNSIDSYYLDEQVCLQNFMSHLNFYSLSELLLITAKQGIENADL